MSRSPKTKDALNITLDFDVLSKLDNARGVAPRSTYINNVLRKEFELT
ncbi:hypothetical protein FXW07_07225 [Methanosarcina sp. DH1]|nr:hypothetical protein [Methanosarcina sp. DH1]MCC4766411.1 hypothetical protein [Methanosarcina sp. DH1]